MLFFSKHFGWNNPNSQKTPQKSGCCFASSEGISPGIQRELTQTQESGRKNTLALARTYVKEANRSLTFQIKQRQELNLKSISEGTNYRQPKDSDGKHHGDWEHQMDAGQTQAPTR